LKGNPSNSATAIAAYSTALKLTFIAGMVSFLIVVFLVLPINLPRLGKQKTLADEEDEVGASQSLKPRPRHQKSKMKHLWNCIAMLVLNRGFNVAQVYMNRMISVGFVEIIARASHWAWM
jgi:hypothetical protein